MGVKGQSYKKIEMSEGRKSKVSDELLHKLLREEVYRVCNSTLESALFASPYPTWKSHEELIALGKSCSRDTTELERVLAEAKSAVLNLQRVSAAERSAMCTALEFNNIRLRDED